jgi:hypothetical protein
LHPLVQSSVLDQMETNQISCFRYNELFDRFTRIIRSDKTVDVITINDEEARQLSGEYSL